MVRQGMESLGDLIIPLIILGMVSSPLGVLLYISRVREITFNSLQDLEFNVWHDLEKLYRPWLGI